MEVEVMSWLHTLVQLWAFIWYSGLCWSYNILPSGYNVTSYGNTGLRFWSMFLLESKVITSYTSTYYRLDATMAIYLNVVMID